MNKDSLSDRFHKDPPLPGCIKDALQSLTVRKGPFSQVAFCESPTRQIGTLSGIGDGKLSRELSGIGAIVESLVLL